jgi:hypothetical protein
LGFADADVVSWIESAGFELVSKDAFSVNKGLVVNIFKAKKG